MFNLGSALYPENENDLRKCPHEKTFFAVLTVEKIYGKQQKSMIIGTFVIQRYTAERAFQELLDTAVQSTGTRALVAIHFSTHPNNM